MFTSPGLRVLQPGGKVVELLFDHDARILHDRNHVKLKCPFVLTLIEACNRSSVDFCEWTPGSHCTPGKGEKICSGINGLVAWIVIVGIITKGSAQVFDNVDAAWL